MKYEFVNCLHIIYKMNFKFRAQRPCCSGFAGAPGHHITMCLHKGAGQQVHEAGRWSTSIKPAAPHPFTGWQAPPRRRSLLARFRDVADTRRYLQYGEAPGIRARICSYYFIVVTSCVLASINILKHNRNFLRRNKNNLYYAK